MRQWSLRAVIVHDLKARVRMALAGDWRPDPPPVFWAPPTFLQCTAQLAVWLARADAGEQIRIAEDIETARGLITCLGLSDSPQFAMSIPFVRKTDSGTFDSWWSQDEEGMLMVLLRRLNTHQNILIEGQNFIYDTQYIQHWLAVTPRLDFDTMLAQNVLFPGTPKSLDYLSSLFCKYHWYWKEDHKEWDMSGTIEQLLLYNCMDCVRTYECATTLRALIVQLKQTEQWKLKMQINDLCLRMMNRGVLIDTKGRAALSMQLAETISQLEHDLHTIVPQDVVAPDAKRPWFSSPQQTAYLFYDRLGFRVETQRKTKRPTVGKDARVALATRYPEFTGLFERLRLHGSCENTHNVINAGLDPDDRMRCSFNPGGAETHRLSSSKNAFGRGTNLQNLTKGEEDE
jgi:DNA polymerase I-like protein with 3'-5' exonuclease and polymerase domains